MKKKILRILLKHYTKIGHQEGIAKVIFDDEFEKIAEEIVNSALVDVSQRSELLLSFQKFVKKHSSGYLEIPDNTIREYLRQ
jgi:hypothetical protein